MTPKPRAKPRLRDVARSAVERKRDCEPRDQRGVSRLEMPRGNLRGETSRVPPRVRVPLPSFTRPLEMMMKKRRDGRGGEGGGRTSEEGQGSERLARASPIPDLEGAISA